MQRELDFYISDKELNHHLFISGATGCGKTSTVKNFILSAIKRGVPLIYIDGKADQKLPEEINSLCKKYKRKFKHFALSEKAQVKYNPLLSGGFTELKDKIIFMFSNARSQQISVFEDEYLQFLLKILKHWGTISQVELDLYIVASFIEPAKFLQLVESFGNEQLIKESSELVQRLDGKLNNLISKLNCIISSQLGHLFKCEPNDTIINLAEDIANGAVIYFSLNDLSYTDYASQIGKLIINDLKTIFGRVNEKVPLKTIAVFDEFTAYAGEEFNSLLSRGRSKGLHAIVSTQGLNTIQQVSSSLASNLITNCNTFIIHKQNNDADAEIFSAIIGKSFNSPTSKLKESSKNITVNLGNNMYKVSPEDILSLKTGYAYILQKNDGSKVDLVKIKRV